MNPEVSERLFIEELFRDSVKKNKVTIENIRSIERLAGDASTRRYYRVFCTNRDYVVCLDDPSGEDNMFVKKQDFFNKAGIRVPRVLDTNSLKGYILEEDLGDVTLLQYIAGIESKKEELRYYKQVIDQLLLIHKLPSRDVSGSRLFDEKFDLAKYQSEIRFSLKYFLTSFLKIKDEALFEQLSESFSEVCMRLADKNMVLTHRDFHSRNIMIKNDEFVIIDFQDARMGIPQYDLASLLDDCYYEIEPSNKIELQKYYFERMKNQIQDQGSLEEFLSLYDDMVIQRVFKAIGSFSYIYEKRDDKMSKIA